MLYEFELDNTGLFQMTDADALAELISRGVINEQLYYEELNLKEIALKGLSKGLKRPFLFEQLGQADFKHIETKSDFEQWLTASRTTGWEEDFEDAQRLVYLAEEEIWSRTSLRQGLWHLSKNLLEDQPEKLVESHWVYVHFETFIEVDRDNQLIRVFDFGYD